MRPTTTDAAMPTGLSRPRKLSDSEADPSNSSPMLYFLADEATMQASTSSSSSNFGVRSLDASVTDFELQQGVSSRNNDNDDIEEEEEELDDGRSMTSFSTSTTAAHIPDFNTINSGSLPLTPMLGPSIAPSPLFCASPATDRSVCAGAEDSEFCIGAATPPQFIMPQIIMPSRRPFTEKGRRMGRLKVLIAGDSGIGKTSLIKSIVQICEDIVHVDPVASDIGAGSSRRGQSGRRGAADAESTRKITEVYASTRAYPHWWSEIDESKVLRRRKSGVEEQVIDRNLVFVDSPGYGSGTSFLECIEPIVRYVEAQFERTQAIISNGDGDLMSLLSGAGTPQVDIVFYVVLHRLKPVDIEFMRRLSPFTNVLPIIAKSDTLTAQQITSLKLSILGELRSANVRPFLFGKSSSDILRSAADHDEDDKDHPTPPITAPFAISSVFSEDAENMDASVLMSSDYIPPLLDTELKLLVDQVFDPDNIAWLKHTVAKKFLGWQRASSTTSLIQLNPNQHHRPNTPPRSPSTRRCSPAPESFALARVADHTLREERLAKVRLSRWANELQKSLAAERERYERLARGERAVWLTERLGECISDGQLVAVRSAGGRRSRSTGEEGGVDTRDPFGILLMNETVGRKVLVMIKIAGLGGLVGVVSVWMYKQWGVQGWSEVLGEVRR